MELSLLHVVAAMGVVGLGAIVQGTIGFGMAVVAAPFLYHIDPALIPGPLIFSVQYFRYNRYSVCRLKVSGGETGRVRKLTEITILDSLSRHALI
ncbi:MULTISPECIES: hypothetical protein [unclassified Endozoicomonas]|uniref:hypothetical protein n=1 Tax=unclassified Endozoicomonas TaxID=2644528 RepID=UPI003BB49DD8